MYYKKTFVVSLLLLSSMSFAQVEDKRVLSEDFDPRGFIEIENQVGSVTVSGSDVQNKITVEVTKRAPNKEDLEKFDVKFEVHDKDTKAKLKSDNVKRVQNAEIHLNVIVPRFTEVEVEDGVGAVTVQNIKGQIKAETKTGDVSIKDARKEVEVRVGTGNIEVSHASDGFGKSDVKTEVGDITIKNAGGSIEAKTSTGNITMVQRILPNQKDIDAKTLQGNVSLNLPTSTNATIKAETKVGSISGGSINWTRKPAKEDTGAKDAVEKVGDQAKAVLGKGFADIDLETKSGSILVNLK